MLSLSFGIAAALAWAVHDLLVRKLTQASAMLPMLLVVLSAGSVALLVLALVIGGWETMGRAAIVPAVAAGLTYVAGCGGLYQALSRAPVRIVAPMLGSFPLLSLAIAAAQGRPVATEEWLAVAAIVAGIGWVATTGRSAGGMTRGSLSAALGWAALGACGFAATFALGQEAARQGAVVPAMVVTRITALAGVLVLCLVRGQLAPAKGIGRVLMLMGCLDALALGMVTASARLPHPEYAAVTSALFGVLTILLAWRFLGERVAPVQWAGIAAVFAGIAALSLQG
ncbi:MAG: DMT family transporter [Rhodobacter sp.]|nr:DMT family transporter [Rhodobacter sp.]